MLQSRTLPPEQVVSLETDSGELGHGHDSCCHLNRWWAWATHLNIYGYMDIWIWIYIPWFLHIFSHLYFLIVMDFFYFRLTCMRGVVKKIGFSKMDFPTEGAIQNLAPRLFWKVGEHPSTTEWKLPESWDRSVSPRGYVCFQNQAKWIQNCPKRHKSV